MCSKGRYTEYATLYRVVVARYGKEEADYICEMADAIRSSDPEADVVDEMTEEFSLAGEDSLGHLRVELMRRKKAQEANAATV